MSVENRLTEFSDRIKQNPISQRFLRAGVRIALAAAVLTPAVIADNISTFVKPASAAESTSTVPTWINRCGSNAHIPFSEQRIINSKARIRLIAFQDTIQYISTYQDWYRETVQEYTQDLNSFYSKRIGIQIAWDEVIPSTYTMSSTLSIYKADVNKFTTEISSIPISVQSTDGEFRGEINYYITDPNGNIDDVFPYPGAWGGSRKVVIPALALKPKDKNPDILEFKRVHKHEWGHIIFGRFHSSNPRNLMYNGVNLSVSDGEVLIEDENLINTCLPGDRDPTITSDMKYRQYLQFVASNSKN